MADALEILAADVGRSVMLYLDTINAVADGRQSDVALPLIHLALSQVALEGARLAAIEDIEAPEPGEDAQAPVGDPEVGARLAVVLEGLDEYTEVVNPLVDQSPRAGRLSADLAEVGADLGPGLHRFADGDSAGALASWQRSYGEGWGPRVASAGRVLQVLVAATRAAEKPSTATKLDETVPEVVEKTKGGKAADATESDGPEPAKK